MLRAVFLHARARIRDVVPQIEREYHEHRQARQNRQHTPAAQQRQQRRTGHHQNGLQAEVLLADERGHTQRGDAQNQAKVRRDRADGVAHRQIHLALHHADDGDGQLRQRRRQ